MVVPEFDCHHPEEGLGGTNARLAIMELGLSVNSQHSHLGRTFQRSFKYLSYLALNKKNTSNIEVFENKSLLLKSNMIKSS